MSKFLLSIIMLIFLGFLTYFVYNLNSRVNIVDDRTKELCRWYAAQDHRGEIGEERFEKMNYLWDDFDWYESCIQNVAGKN